MYEEFKRIQWDLNELDRHMLEHDMSTYDDMTSLVLLYFFKVTDISKGHPVPQSSLQVL